VHRIVYTVSFPLTFTWIHLCRSPTSWHSLTFDTISTNIMPLISTVALTAMVEGMPYPPPAQLPLLTHLRVVSGYLADDFEDRYGSANTHIMSFACSCLVQP
jgi:hypothetical protein